MHHRKLLGDYAKRYLDAKIIGDYEDSPYFLSGSIDPFDLFPRGPTNDPSNDNNGPITKVIVTCNYSHSS